MVGSRPAAYPVIDRFRRRTWIAQITGERESRRFGTVRGGCTCDLIRVDLFPDETFGGVEDGGPHRLVAHAGDDAADDLVDHARSATASARRRRGRRHVACSAASSAANACCSGRRSSDTGVGAAGAAAASGEGDAAASRDCDGRRHGGLCLVQTSGLEIAVAPGLRSRRVRVGGRTAESEPGSRRRRAGDTGTAAAPRRVLARQRRVEAIEVVLQRSCRGFERRRRRRVGGAEPSAGRERGLLQVRRLAMAGEQIAHAADHHLRLERLDEHAVAADRAARATSSTGSKAPVSSSTEYAPAADRP